MFGIRHVMTTTGLLAQSTRGLSIPAAKPSSASSLSIPKPKDSGGVEPQAGTIKKLAEFCSHQFCVGLSKLDVPNSVVKENINIALYSASRNAKKILTQLNIIDLFSVIIDGNNVSNSKPDPEGFKKAADLAITNTENCVVFEDSYSGIAGANKLNMYTVGIGSKDVLNNAKVVYRSFKNLKIKDIINVQ